MDGVFPSELDQGLADIYGLKIYIPLAVTPGLSVDGPTPLHFLCVLIVLRSVIPDDPRDIHDIDYWYIILSGRPIRRKQSQFSK